MQTQYQHQNFKILNKLKTKIIIFTALLLSTISLKAQTEPFQKGDVLAFFGWNRAWYSNSDIHFSGQDYDFTLENVVAHDRPTPISKFNEYIDPTKITIPQVNYNFTYFIKDGIGITLGIDHMKYVMDQNQTVDFNGYIDNPVYQNYVQNGKVNLADGKFLKYEHTNGLNYINLGVQKYKHLINKNKFDVFVGYGFGAGAFVPKTDATLMSKEESDHFHLAGFGADARTSINLVAWKHFVAKAEFKFVYVNLPSVRTTVENVKVDKATQAFTASELVFGIGYTFKTKKKL